MLIGRRKFAALEGWRGVCAMLVAVSHFGHGITWHLGESAFVLNSYLFVDFFFVLSGFVIAHAYADRIHSAVSIGAFALRRIGRLWPLHAFVLAAWVAAELVEMLTRHLTGAVAAHAAFTASRTPEGLLATLLLIQGFVSWNGEGWNFPSWSIGVELWTCLIFALTCPRPERQRLLLAAALSLGGLAALLWAGQYMRVFLGYGFFRGLYGFFLGTLVYRVYSTRPDRQFGYPSLLEGLCVCLAAVFIAFFGNGPSAMVAPIVFAGVVYVFAFEAGVFSRALLSRPVSRLGTWSYSIYLNHYLLLLLIVVGARAILKILGEGPMAPEPLILGNLYAADAMALVYIAVVIGISAVTYRWIENPWRRRFNAWAGRFQGGKIALSNRATGT